MHVPNIIRASTECPSGSLYYVCVANNFSGCCTTNACSDEGCLDSSSSSSSSSSPTTTSTKGATTTLTTTRTTTSATTIATAGDPVSASQASTSLGSSATASTTGSTSAAAAATGEAPGGTSGSSSSSSGLSSGALAGIVVGCLLGFLLLAALFFWRCFWLPRKQRKQQEQPSMSQQAPSAGGFASAGAGAIGPVKPPGGVVAPDGNAANDSLYGETSPGGVEASIAKWGLHGARLAALRRKKQGSGSVRSQTGVDMGGSYMGDASALKEGGDAKYGIVPPPPIAELDAEAGDVVAELESPESTPAIGAPSPALSNTGSQGGSTFVSSWRSSSRTMDGTVLGSAAVTPELDSTPRMSVISAGGRDDAYRPTPTPTPSQQPGASGGLLPNLDLPQTERNSGTHVASWGTYQP